MDICNNSQKNELYFAKFMFLFGIIDNITQMIPAVAHQTVPTVAH